MISGDSHLNLSRGRMHSIARPLPVLLLGMLLVLQEAQRALAAAPDSDGWSGSYPGRVVGEIMLHRQSALRLARSGFQTQTVSPSASVDIGNIAVLPDDGTLVTQANTFDLQQKSLLFEPALG